MKITTLRNQTLAFIESNRLGGNRFGEYRYSSAAAQPTIYSSTYAAATRSLYNDLDTLNESLRQEWIDYFNGHQDDDGLFRDPVIFDQGWYKDDPFWCGRPHLTCHVLTALSCLGGIARKPFVPAGEFASPDVLRQWLKQRDWGRNVATTGNEIMNLGTILQYARDFHNDERAGKSVTVILDWLETNHIDPQTGMWGDVDTSDPIGRSQAVQAAYHWWALFFHDSRPIPHMQRAIDTLLDTSNPMGGFGWGVHNPDEPFKSSACEDIDSIDPLARLSFQTEYRKDDIHAALKRALDWLLKNRTPDGGFVFMLDRPFEYGHGQLHGEKNKGAMFPTWFRTLTIALLGKALSTSWAGKYPWDFVRCPGYQFWL